MVRLNEDAKKTTLTTGCPSTHSAIPRSRHAHAASVNGASPDKAYEIAGYSRNRANCYTLRKKPHIKARIAELLAEREKRLGDITEKAIEKAALTKSYVIERLMENVARAMQHEAVKDAKGNPIGEYRYDGATANRALELLGKELGMFIDRKEVRHKNYWDTIDDAEELRARLLEFAEGVGERLLAVALIGEAGEAGGKPN